MLAAMIEDCQSRGEAFGRGKGVITKPDQATIWHMVQAMVKILTSEKKTSYVDYVKERYSGADQADHCGQAGALLSYAWAHRYLDVIETLVEWAKKEQRDPKCTYVWVCSTCVNQQAIPENLAGTFGDRVKKIGTILPMRTMGQPGIHRPGLVYEPVSAVDGVLAGGQLCDHHGVPAGRAGQNVDRFSTTF